MYLTVYTGCMFSGKTDGLMQKVQEIRKKEKDSTKNTYLYKPKIDDRYSSDHVVTHDGKEMRANRLIDPNDSDDIRCIKRKKSRGEVVAIDEAQFFDSSILHVIDELIRRGTRVIAAALCRDFRNEIFEVAAHLSAKADFLHKKSALCHQCGRVATRTQRLTEEGEVAPASGPRIKIGGNEEYEARCYNCWEDPFNL